MPLVFEILDDPSIVVTRAVGLVANEDLRAHAEALAKVSGRPLQEIVDFSEGSIGDIDMEAIRDTAHYLRDLDDNQAGGRLALVGGSDSVYGSLRVYAAHRQHPSLDIGVFRSCSEAFEWLGIPREHARDLGGG